MRLALYQPDIPQNAGALLRLGACFQVPVDIIEPCGFPYDDKRLRRAGMDYADACTIQRHSSWRAFRDQFRAKGQGRLLLLTTKGRHSYASFNYQPGDILLLGRESAGVPQDVHEESDAELRIPMASEARSLNVVTAAAIVLSEALRQQGFFYLNSVS